MGDGGMERLISAFERIADALGDLCVIQKRRYDRDYPERRDPREAVISRIPNEEDKAKERQGAGDEPIGDWFGGFEEPEYIGVREKAFLEEEARKRNASAKDDGKAGSRAAGHETSGGRARGRGKRARGDSSIQIG